MGLPCVGTRAAGLEEAVSDGVTGTLVPPENAEALAAALERLLSDPAEVDRLSAGAKAAVADVFDADRNFERLLALFASDGASDEPAATSSRGAA
jgi:glycosyltransferase involved in cell wall biosynthesis